MLNIFLNILEIAEMLKVFFRCPRNPGNVKHFFLNILETGEILKVFLRCPRNPGNVKHVWGQFQKVLKTREC